MVADAVKHLAPASVVARWLCLSLPLHLAWELAQLPLYTIYAQGRAGEIVFAVAHCTGGDGVIALGTYAAASLAARTWRWPVDRARIGLGVVLLSGVAYTAFSEWLNVSVRGSWAYAPAMPRIAGIGLSPLAQWIVVPAVAFALLRRAVRPLQERSWREQRMALPPEPAHELRRVIDGRRAALLSELRKDVDRSREQQYRDLAGPAPDPGDESVADLIADLDHAEVEREVGELRMLDAARSRMDEGSYGECVQCGTDIQYERLRANPSALRCIDCQSLFEKTYAQGGGGASL